MKQSKLKDSTIAARAAVDEDKEHGAVMPPVYLSTNFTFSGYGTPRTYDYTRSGNPTRTQLANTIAKLEGGCGGVITASGMGALNVVFHLLNVGDTIIAPHDCYGGTYRLLEACHNQGHYNVIFTDQTDSDSLNKAFSNNPRMILIETPSNPLLRLVDIQKIATKAHDVGALVVADNTFLSPALQKPLSLGADIVVHSTTKYLNGHSDVVGGAIIANDAETLEKLTWWANCLGTTGAPFDSYLTLRGLRTLGVRIKQQQETTGKIISFLNEHPTIDKIYYPGLEAHPGHDIAKKQQNGFGAMLSFELKGNEDSVRNFLQNLSLFSLAESLGGVESLIAHPATMTHAAMAPEAREKAGINNSLLRLSIGLEEPDDLINDLDYALETIKDTYTKTGA